MTLPPIQTSSSMCTSLPPSGPFNPRRTAGSIGCVAPYMQTFGPNNTFSPMVIRQVSRTSRLKFKKVPLPTLKFNP
ncbi:unnamed protein product [Penicillium olsonii]|nr:unnamed protein product [Penicillium olsonii]